MTTEYAFFDFDETVYVHKSMFDFAKYYLESIDELHGRDRYENLMEQVGAMAERGVDRSEINQFYYSQFAGHSEAVVEQKCEDWYESLRESGEPYLIESTVAEIERLKSEGATLALVSGAFAPILKPFARELGIGELICTSPIVVEGCFTNGLNGAPVIGREKAVRVAKFLQDHGGSTAESSAYGDHISDVAMLESVGSATVVKPNAELEALALARGWKILR